MNLRKAAKGQPCMLRLPGCSPGEENNTVVLCHHRGAGMGMKSDDTDAVLGCFNCHQLLDGPEFLLIETAWHGYDEIFEAAKRRTLNHWKRLGYSEGQ